MRQANDAPDAPRPSVQYQEFEAFPEPQLTAQWRVLDRLDQSIEQMNAARAAPLAPFAGAAAAFRAGRSRPASAEAAGSLLRRYGANLPPPEPRLADLLRRGPAEEG